MINLETSKDKFKHPDYSQNRLCKVTFIFYLVLF